MIRPGIELPIYRVRGDAPTTRASEPFASNVPKWPHSSDTRRVKRMLINFIKPITSYKGRKSWREVTALCPSCSCFPGFTVLFGTPTQTWELLYETSLIAVFSLNLISAFSICLLFHWASEWKNFQALLLPLLSLRSSWPIETNMRIAF